MDTQLFMPENAEICFWKSHFSFILLHQGCSSGECHLLFNMSSSIQHLRVWFAQFGKFNRRTTLSSLHLQTTWHFITPTPQQSKPQKMSATVQRTNQLNMRSDLCVAICKFSQVVCCHLEQIHAQSTFLFPIVYTFVRLPRKANILCGIPVNVDRVTEMRLLGVIVDNQLSWSSQVNSVISKVCRQKTSILRGNMHKLSPSVFSSRRLFNRTPNMQQHQQYPTCPFLCVIASVLYGDGQCTVSPGRIGKLKLPPLWKLVN